MEENLIELVAEGGAVVAKVRGRLASIAEERLQARAELEGLGPKLAEGIALIQAALDLVEDPQELYRQTTDLVRRQLNQVFFDRLYVDGREIVDDQLAEPFDGLLFHRHRRRPTVVHRRAQAPRKANDTPKGAASRAFTCAALLDQFSRGNGSSKATTVGDTGIAPVTPAV